MDLKQLPDSFLALSLPDAVPDCRILEGEPYEFAGVIFDHGIDAMEETAVSFGVLSKTLPLSSTRCYQVTGRGCSD